MTLLLMTKPKRKKLADSGDMTRFSPRAGLSSSPAGGLIYVCEFVSYLSDYVLTAFVEGESAGLPSRQKKREKKANVHAKHTSSCEMHTHSREF